MLRSPQTRITVAEATLRWGASLASLWLVGDVFLLAVAYQSTDLQLGWTTTLFLLGSATLGGVTWGVFAYDKRQAQLGDRRVSEATLYAFTLLGGWSGAFLAQRWLRHKSQKLLFQIAAWAGLLLHCLAMLVVLGWL
jgi:uncharacterized membrane protein YsdA (DUF1294 family)